MAKFRMNQRVHITSIQKVDGSKAIGVIVGILKYSNNICHISFKDYLKNLSKHEYFVAIDYGARIETLRVIEEKLENV